MKTKKQYLILIIVCSLIFIIGFSFVFKRKKEIQLIVPFDKNYTQEKNELEKIIPSIEIKQKEKIGISQEIKISLDVLGSVYKVEVEKDTSVFEAMRKIQNENNLFSFKYRETSGLGNFITEINGLKGTPGKYWIYYVNDKKATIGVSQYLLKEGDIIKWNQEGL